MEYNDVRCEKYLLMTLLVAKSEEELQRLTDKF